jgi:predicted nucleic acid-binding protein
MLDASVLMAAMQPEDSHHAHALRILRHHAVSEGLLVHGVTLAESAVGAARAGHIDALQRACRRLGLNVVPSDDGEPWRVAVMRAETGLGLPDCYVLDAARRTQALLASFDARLNSAAVVMDIGLVD